VVNIGLLHTGLRGEEKLICQAAKIFKVNCELIDVRKEILNSSINKDWSKNDIYIERCIATSMGLHSIRYLDNINIEVINSIETAQICNSKFATTTRLLQCGVPTVPAYLVFTEEQAKNAVEKLGGYPVVVKSDSGSWGRLMAKVSDEQALESIVEHKQILGGVNHNAIYIQQYVRKPGRDIRTFVFGSELKAAIYRNSEHWITNTARGGKASKCNLDIDLVKICKDTALALATDKVKDGGIIALDVFEDEEKGYLVNEVNHTMEFKNSEEPTGVSISNEIIQYLIDRIKK
jgi:[lysine-biosynthesis-protein LysW]---L-2-aminoadipate ligase